MASHTGETLYTCTWCPKTFNSDGNMYNHRKKCHPKEWEEARRKKYSNDFIPKNPHSSEVRSVDSTTHTDIFDNQIK